MTVANGQMRQMRLAGYRLDVPVPIEELHPATRCLLPWPSRQTWMPGAGANSAMTIGQDGPIRPLRFKTVDAQATSLRRFASALVKADILPINRITGLGDLIAPDRVSGCEYPPRTVQWCINQPAA